MRIAVILTSIVALSACTPAAQKEPTATRGAMLFADNCAACHGGDAKGSGSASLGNGIPAPDLTTLTERFGGTFPRDHVLAVLDGGERSDDPDAVMPEFGDSDLGTVSHPSYGPNSQPEQVDFFSILAYLEAIQTTE